MLNKYMDRLELLLRQYRDIELKQFVGPSGDSANFDDLVWYHVCPNTGRKTRYLCGIHGCKGAGNAGNRPEYILPYPYSHLIKVWIIETVNAPISSTEKKARVSAARALISLMKGDLHIQTELSVQCLKLGSRSRSRLQNFFTFCSGKGLMRRFNVQDVDGRDRTGHASLDTTIEKLPNIESILALGNIFSCVFEHVNDDGEVSLDQEVNIHDAFVVTSTLLSLAAPNRSSVEIPLLPKQRLNLHSEGLGPPVYYLDWIGSKGYKDNKNHMLAALSQPIKKALNFFYKACEPARILARFYENPNQTLGKLLGEFEVDPVFKRNLSFTKIPTLFTLGYALGFYGVDDCVPVLKENADVSSVYHAHRGRCFYLKPIYSLTCQDQLSVSRNQASSVSGLPYLFGYTFLPEIFKDKLVVSVSEVQAWWLILIKTKILPEFPRSFSSGESSVKLKDAMFCFLGSWFYKKENNRGSGGKPFQKSSYMLVPLASLGASLISRLNSRPDSAKGSIFQAYGFSTELRIQLHSLRHFTNTLADLSAIPVEVITAWSGRKSSEQTLTYIHTTHDERAERVSAIMSRPDIDERNIRIISQLSLVEATNLPASVTSIGLCTQNLNITPCNYLNDFVAQCFLCAESCYVAGDIAAIELFEKDHFFQSSRLSSVASDARLSTSFAMQKWFEIHTRNIHILSVLIRIMKSSLPGTLIRYSGARSEFLLTDLETMVVTSLACELPDSERALRDAVNKLANVGRGEPNAKLLSLMSLFGLSDEA